VPKGVNSYAGHAVKVGYPVFIKQTAALAVGKGDWKPPISIHQMRHEITPRKAVCKKTYGSHIALWPPCFESASY
jgi:hypothetical protein